ncbi:hypothetical protein XELAEV_18046181mg [Xenopus laevis]|uniref:Uncharacterized protein n=1 Tax=Xenopus laevis TaxID=8355 RepID=A0A974BSP4_XENLA|nr:hypothetical protein XELAEV_18046181mg [Xenopus laevis]
MGARDESALPRPLNPYRLLKIQIIEILEDCLFLVISVQTLPGHIEVLIVKHKKRKPAITAKLWLGTVR